MKEGSAISQVMQLVLYGPPAAFEYAKALLENQPQVRRVQDNARSGEIRLLLSNPMTEGDLVTLLAQSGISGMSIC